ncbi:hypothetical protein HPP92_026469 [Vanilla planifolia]|uniref:non-specific serine/threonine protein kinase n=1 Tax=Vanilla planifolia TaxID=51239 RepID=A0A835U760_VANPL|nr:hypothetical protein HPP92_026694 [Vanilla planifolia]KAG0450998.1 hypothetical protein HPP92_026469 [Vanilla planifolia]
MASKTIIEEKLEQQLRSVGNGVAKLELLRHSISEISEHVEPKPVADGSVDGSYETTESKKIHSDHHNMNQTTTQCEAPEVLHLNGPPSLDGNSGDLEKKNSEQINLKYSSSSTKVSDVSSNLAKSSGSAKVSGRAEFVDSVKSSMCRASTSSDISDGSCCSSRSSSISKPHKSNDFRWEAIQGVRGKDGVLGLSHFRLLKKLGCGDIGSVYLSELRWNKVFFLP